MKVQHQEKQTLMLQKHESAFHEHTCSFLALLRPSLHDLTVWQVETSVLPFRKCD